MCIRDRENPQKRGKSADHGRPFNDTVESLSCKRKIIEDQQHQYQSTTVGNTKLDTGPTSERRTRTQRKEI